MSRSTCLQRGLRSFWLAAALIALLPAQSMAIPVLQLYVEGSTYDPGTETWTLASSSPTFRLWAIANITGPGGVVTSDVGTVATGWKFDGVRLSAAYPSEYGNVGIGLTPTIAAGTGLYEGFTDTSTPVAPVFLGSNLGGEPTLGTGKSLGSHGIFGPDTAWKEWDLGLFGSQNYSGLADLPPDSPVGDFIKGFPSPSEDKVARINVYDVTVEFPETAGPDAWVHFDLYDHVTSVIQTTIKVKQSKKGPPVPVTTTMYEIQSEFAPFSHDAENMPNSDVPEPASLAIWLVLGLAACGWGWRRRLARG